MKPYEDIIEEAMNKSVDDIIHMNAILRESQRLWLSRFLMDNDENNPLSCYITLTPAGSFGLSELEKPAVISIYQQSGEGLIWIQFDGCGDVYVALEDVDTDCATQLIYELNKIDEDELDDKRLTPQQRKELGYE